MSRRERTLIIGALGQVGRALFTALGHTYQIFSHDTRKRIIKDPDGKETHETVFANPEKNQGLVINICFPGEIKNFNKRVEEYNEIYKPKLMIIHSSVTPGTTYELVKKGLPVVHSPVVFYDNQFASLSYFRKMIGYDNADLGLRAEEYLRPAFNTALVKTSMNTELADICLNLYMMSDKAMIFEMFRMFVNHNCDYKYMMEFINYNNFGYSAIRRMDMSLPNQYPDLNKEDFRYKLISLLDEKNTSAFFKLSKKSYDLEIERKKGHERVQKPSRSDK